MSEVIMKSCQVQQAIRWYNPRIARNNTRRHVISFSINVTIAVVEIEVQAIHGEFPFVLVSMIQETQVMHFGEIGIVFFKAHDNL